MVDGWLGVGMGDVGGNYHYHCYHSYYRYYNHDCNDQVERYVYQSWSGLFFFSFLPVGRKCTVLGAWLG